MRVLNADAGRFCGRFGVTGAGNYKKGQNILNLIETDGWKNEPEDFGALRETVRGYRKNRAPLHRDDKVLTAWNGLLIAALSRAGTVFDEPRYLDAAARAAEFIETRMRDANGRLLTRWRDGEAAHSGKLDDYAFYAWGLLELYGATLRARHLEQAAETAE